VIGSIGRAMARCALCVAAAMLTRRPCKIPTNSTSRQRDYLLLELLDPVHCALQHERGFCAAHRAIRRQISYDSTKKTTHAHELIPVGFLFVLPIRSRL
jgi:hypothetical protein